MPHYKHTSIMVYLFFLSSIMTNNVRKHRSFLWRQRNHFTANLLAFQEICHIVPQDSHGLHSFQILFDFFGSIAVNHVPVAGCDDGHAFDGKVFVDFIKSCRSAGASATDHSSPNFSAEISAVKSSVKERNQSPGSGSEVNGCAKDKAVSIFSFFQEFVNTVIAEATICFFK